MWRMKTVAKHEWPDSILKYKKVSLGEIQHKDELGPAMFLCGRKDQSNLNVDIMWNVNDVEPISEIIIGDLIRGLDDAILLRW